MGKQEGSDMNAMRAGVDGLTGCLDILSLINSLTEFFP
jgi:hypothetical protein